MMFSRTSKKMGGRVQQRNRGRRGSFVIEGARWHYSRVLAPHDNSVIEGVGRVLLECGGL